MAKKSNIELDYDEIAKSSNTLALKAYQMQQTISAAFKEIESMKENWQGKSYDMLLSSVINPTIVPFNQLFEKTVSDIPHEIYAKAKSLAKADQSDLTVKFSDISYKILTEISLTNKGSKLRFRSEKVRSSQAKITSSFNVATSYIQEALQIVDTLKNSWDSASGKQNCNDLKNAFQKATRMIEYISDSVKKQIEAQANSIDTIEDIAEGVEAFSTAFGDFVEGGINAVKGGIDAAIDAAESAANSIWKNLTGQN